MTRPRQVLPERYYLITRRCTQRQFLLTPSPEVNNAIAYCLAHAAQRFQIVVLMTTVESNHHHTVIYDEEGNFPRFIEHFHKLVAKCINVHRGHRENLWAPGQTTVTELLDYGAVIEKLAYAAANPVKDMLVERATQWPGLNGYVALINKKKIKARRPHFFFRRDPEKWPEELTLTFIIPEKLGPRAEIVAEVKARVEVYEAEARRSNRRVLGRKAIREQSWRLAPKNKVEAPRTIRPRFAGRRARISEAAIQYRAFLERYQAARGSWVACGLGQFPAGTYWLARHTPLAMFAPQGSRTSLPTVLPDSRSAWARATSARG